MEERYGRIHWASIIGGALVGIASWLVLTAPGYAIGFGTTSVTSIDGLRSIGLGVSIWVAICAAIAWFIGSYAASRFARVQLASDGLLYGLAVWGLLSVVRLVLNMFIMSNIFVFFRNWVAAALRIPTTVNTTATGIQDATSIVATVALNIFATGLLGLAGALLGGWLGSRRLSAAEAASEEARRERMAA